MSSHKGAEQLWPLIRLLSIVCMLLTPLLLLYMTKFYRRGLVDEGPKYLVFSILILIAALGPLVMPIMERAQIKQFKAGKARWLSATMLSFGNMNMKIAMPTAVYIYGLIHYLLFHDLILMLCFYPIGILWSIKLWPRRGKYEEFLQELEQP